MISAAVIPYLRKTVDPATGIGTCCVVVIVDTARPPGESVLADEEIPVGYIDTSGARPVRVVGPGEIKAVVGRAVTLMVAYGVREMAVEMPDGSGVEVDRARTIGLAIVEGMPGVLSFNVAPVKGDLAARLAALLPKKDEGPGSRNRRAFAAARDTLQPPAGVTEVTHRVPTRGSGDDQPTSAPTAAQAPKLGRRVAGIDPGAKHIAVSVVEALVERVGGVQKSESAAKDHAHPLGVVEDVECVELGRVPSFGDAHHVERGDSEPQNERAQVTHAAQPTSGVTSPQPLARLVAWLPLTIGRAVTLRTPKVITRGDKTITKTHRHEVTDADRLEALRAIAAFCAEHDIDEAVVETATHAHAGAGAMLLRAQDIGGEIAGWLRAAGVTVRRVSSATWRAVAKKRAGLRPRGERNGNVSVQQREFRGGVGGSGAGVPEGEPRDRLLVYDAQRDEGLDQVRQAEEGQARPRVDWRPAIRALVSDLPALPPDAREHVLDATGAAAWALIPPEEKREPRPVTPRKPGGKGKGNESRRARQDRERAAMGCLGGVCRARGKRGHDPACPIAVARNAKVGEKMMGNRNAERGARA